ncbi:hypothetical protein H0A71_13155 [Alcaligenaceae bacterium]|nr:hypothetical protein [Alcaligenaceae bacterium]
MSNGSTFGRQWHAGGQTGVLHRQAGQAMAEGVVVFGLLLAFFVATGWLGRLQDIAMTAQHASSLAAFMVARSDHTPQQHRAIVRADRFFLGQDAQRWLDLQGHSLVHGAHAPHVLSAQYGQLPAHAQPGGTGTYARGLRHDWGMGNHSVVTATVRMPWRGPGGVITPVSSGSSIQEATTSIPDDSTAGLANDKFLHRHTVLLAGAGHASHDDGVAARTGHSWFAWRRSAQASLRLAERVSRVMEPVDAAWHRPSVTTDWIARWAGRVPRSHLTSAASSASAH